MKKGCLIALGATIGGLALVVAASYLLSNPETKALTSETRTHLPGQFITLADGVTHYQLSGPVDGPVVVLVDGFSIPYFSWERNVPALTAAGFRVLQFDLYGRGYSDRPTAVYDLNLFTRQIDELLTALQIKRPVEMAAISMGGHIAAGFANRYPGSISKLVLVSPIVNPVSSNPALKIVTLPGLGQYLYNVYLARNQIVDSQDAFQAYVADSDWRARELDAMQYKGIRNALLATLRQMNGDPMPEYRKLGASGLPVELLWGDQDTTVLFTNSVQVQAAIPQAVFHQRGTSHLTKRRRSSIHTWSIF